MTERRKVKDLEACLGLRYSLSRDTHAHRIPQIKKIIEVLKSLSTQYASYTRLELQETDFEDKVKRELEVLGPYVWPDDNVEGVDRFTYLANPPREDLRGWYPRSLYYSKTKDAAKYDTHSAFETRSNEL